MTKQPKIDIPAGRDSFTDEEFRTSTQQTRDTLAKVDENPIAAKAKAALSEKIDERVHTLQTLRKVLGLTQEQMAKQLGVDQGEVSRIERRVNLHLETLSRFIEATGGKLRITAVYDETELEVKLGDLTQNSVTETVETTSPTV